MAKNSNSQNNTQSKAEDCWDKTSSKASSTNANNCKSAYESDKSENCHESNKTTSKSGSNKSTNAKNCHRGSASDTYEQY